MFNHGKKSALVLALLVSSLQLNAANWLNLQGVQPEVVAPKGVKVPYRSKTPKLWGFIQANYKEDKGEVFIGGDGKTKTPFSLLNPDLSGQSGFNVFRARLALRGMADKENKVNYFFMTESGNNGINNLAGHREIATYFTDASVTMKNIPGMKVRMGMFKTPSTEEGLQAVFVSPYIEFTTMANQQHLERKVRSVTGSVDGTILGDPVGPVGAYRDTGVQLFDTFDLGNGLDISYAYMLGNGSGVSMSANNENKTTYAYLALEKKFGKGRGYYTESAKFFLWSQNGVRKVFHTDSNSTESYDRDRSGLGATYYRNGLRLEAEYTKASGMIFNGPVDTDTNKDLQDWQFQFLTGSQNKAIGYYINAQYELQPKKLEVFARYDKSERATNLEATGGERIFTTTTVGASYRFKGPTRVDFNYLMREAKAPNNSTAQGVLDRMGDRIAIQFTAAF